MAQQCKLAALMRSLGVLLALLFAATGVTLGQGIITTMAGNGLSGCGPLGDGGPATAAQLCGPVGSVTDAAGNVYFYDSSNHRIRQITPAGIIGTIAGNGTSGTSGDGGPALNASLGRFSQLALDPTGQRLCFGDSAASKIRCVFLATGIIQGYGTGNFAYGGLGDGGNVADATFNNLSGIAFDDLGNLYVSDSTDSRVRRVDAVTSIITTYAGATSEFCCTLLGDGGPALGANLNGPRELAYGNGGLYIADFSNCRVRRVDTASGIITTVAGNGSPYDSGTSEGGPATATGIVPGGILLDNSGNLFIELGTAVRMVDASGIIATVAGSLTIDGYGSDDIPATQTVFGGITGMGWDSFAKRLLISDGSRIRQIFFTPPTTTALTVSPNPAYPGEQITFQATVSPTGATGSVRFYQNSVLLASSPVTSGVALFNLTAGTVSVNSVRAVYGGDPTHNLSSSDTQTLNVKIFNTTTTLASSLNPSVQGQAVTFIASIAPAFATGSVTFLLNNNAANPLGRVPVVKGVAMLTTAALPAGTNSVTTNYVSTGCCYPSTSPAIAQVVKNVTTTSLSSSLNPSVFGSVITLTAVVSPATATGAVQFLNGGTPVGSANLVNGKAQLPLAVLPAGSNSLSANYVGDLGNAASVSGLLLQTVNKANSTTSISANPVSQASSGQTVTFTAKVTPGAASGTVRFLDGSTLIGSSTLLNGTAAFSTSSLGMGTHSIKASYGGDNNVNGGTSTSLSYRIKH